MKESVVYFSLGSNIGDRQSNLINCIKLIEEKAGNINLVSSIYKNSAQGFDGDYFYNLCLEITTSGVHSCGLMLSIWNSIGSLSGVSFM